MWIEPYSRGCQGIGRAAAVGREMSSAVPVMSLGCPVAAELPKDLPPGAWSIAVLQPGAIAACSRRSTMRLVITDRAAAARSRFPAAIIDSQSIKTTEAGGRAGYDAGKKINGAKRHALVDTDGRGPMIEPHPASIQDRDGAGCSASLPPLVSFHRAGFADGGYAGERVATATRIIVEIVAKRPDQIGFAVCRADGWSSGSLPGSAATEGLPKISRPASPPPGPSFTPLPSCCSHAASRGSMSFENRP